MNTEVAWQEAHAGRPRGGETEGQEIETPRSFPPLVLSCVITPASFLRWPLDRELECPTNTFFEIVASA